MLHRHHHLQGTQPGGQHSQTSWTTEALWAVPPSAPFRLHISRHTLRESHGTRGNTDSSICHPNLSHLHDSTQEAPDNTPQMPGALPDPRTSYFYRPHSHFTLNPESSPSGIPSDFPSQGQALLPSHLGSSAHSYMN